MTTKRTFSTSAMSLSKTAAAGLCLATLMSGGALACPANPGPMLPNAIRILENNAPTGPVSNSVQIEIDGLTSIGSAADDSCAVVPDLPEGLTAVSVSVLDAETGNPVGFRGFRADLAAKRGFCGADRTRCQAFVSRVSDPIKADTRLKVVIEAAVSDVIDPRLLVKLSRQLTRDASFALGGVDRKGRPHHHLTVLRPSSVDVVLAEATDTAY